MLTASDLRWMEEQRRRAALRRTLETDDRTLATLGLERSKAEALLGAAINADLCAGLAHRPALARRIGCPR